MREILFRGKRCDDGEWVMGYMLMSEWNNSVYIVTQDECNYNAGGSYFDGHIEEVIPETVGQYTGLTDKNGKKIFEGDIVLYVDEEGYYPEEQCEFVGRIVFEKGAFGIATDDNIPIDLSYWCDNDNFVSLWELYWNLSVEGETLDMLEVIGNIHDNPELLKGETNA